MEASLPKRPKIEDKNVPVENRSSGRQRSTRKRNRNAVERVYKAFRLMSLPIEVLLMIFEELLPIDLLRLSWTSKDIRSVVMSRKLASVWRVARQNHFPPVPSCPDDISEPQWAALLFSKICQACGAPRSMRVHYSLRTIHCKACYSKYIGSVMDVAQKAEHRLITHWWLGDVVPTDEAVACRAAAKDVVCRLDEASDAILEFRKIGEYDFSARERFMESREKRVQMVHLHAFEVKVWAGEIDRMREEKKSATIKKRLESIEARLALNGWEIESSLAIDPEWASLTVKNQDITPRVWSDLYPKLVALLENHAARNSNAGG